MEEVAQPSCGNPITPATGNKYQRESDYIGTGLFPLEFTRHYNSSHFRVYELGSGWQHNYNLRLSLTRDGVGNPITVNSARPDGKEAVFNKSGSIWSSYTDNIDKLEEVLGSDGLLAGWRYTRGQGDVVENYDASGKLQSIVKREGLAQTFTYSQNVEPNATAPGPGLMIGVTDSLGLTLAGSTYPSI